MKKAQNSLKKFKKAMKKDQNNLKEFKKAMEDVSKKNFKWKIVAIICFIVLKILTK